MLFRSDNWGSAIGTDDEGTAEAGNLAGGGKNIPAPEAGLHMVMADMKNLAYSTFEVTSVACTGFNDEWALIEMTQDAENPGLFTATVNISSFAWGFHLVLNNEWGYKYGGKDGVIYYNGQNMEDDKALAENPGEYTLTVDIVKRTYSLK